jgi:hypothetical protein
MIIDGSAEILKRQAPPITPAVLIGNGRSRVRGLTRRAPNRAGRSPRPAGCPR